MKNTLATCLLVLLSLSIWAQHEAIEKELIALNKKFIEKEQIGLIVDYLYFETHSSQDPYYTEKGKFLKDGKDYYTEMFGIKNMSQGDLNLLVDEGDREMVLSKSRFQYVNDAINPEAIHHHINTCKRVERIEEDGEVKFIFTMDKQVNWEFERLEIVYLKDSGLPKSISIYFPYAAKLYAEDQQPDKPRLEIRYSPSDNIEMVNIKTYIAKKGKSYLPTGNYSNYVLHNQIHKL